MPRIRIIFFGTESFALEILVALHRDERFDVMLVVTKPARAVGRAQTLTECPVLQYAHGASLPVTAPEKIRAPEFLTMLANARADIIIVAQYGKIIPEIILTLATHGAVNIHASLLPRWRGATPVHAAIAAGDTCAGITYMVMDEQMDHGPLIANYEAPVAPDATTTQLMDELGVLAAHTAPEVIADFLSGTRMAQEQQHEQATYTSLLTKESGDVSCATQSATEIERLVRALTPWPHVRIVINDLSIKIIRAHKSDSSLTPTSIMCRDGVFQIGTRVGSLVIDELVLAGKKQMSGAAFSHGYTHLHGSRVSEPSNPSRVFLQSLHAPARSDVPSATT